MRAAGDVGGGRGINVAMPPKILRRSFVAVLIAWAALWFWPWHSAIYRMGCIGGLGLVWLLGMVAIRRSRWRWLGAMIPVLIAAPFMLPAKSIPAEELRTDYLGAMKSMEGARYVWGGEGLRGIDCSGLPRRGLRDALWKSGWRHGNGAAFREWARQWWFDASAKALGQGYRGFTTPLGISGVLRDLDLSKLQPGDLAVTADGRHVMVYYGVGQWIQADPSQGHVFIAKPADYPNSWFDNAVSMHRWTVLSE